MNAGIQGLAADIFKVALVRIDEALERAGDRQPARPAGARRGARSRCPTDERDEVGPLVVDLMRRAAELDVPLEVNVAWGRTWADAKSAEADRSTRACR